MKLDRLVTICLNKTYSKVHIGKYLSHTVPVQSGLKHRDALAPSLFNFALEYDTWKVQENKVKQMEWVTKLLVYRED
jgi:hypothetical protein